MLQRFAVLLWVVLPSVAFAAGLTFGENGAKSLSLGGAFAGQADDLTAVQFNPAGLALQPGHQFLLDVQMLNQDVTFLRAQDGTPELARNTGGLFLLPFAAGSTNFTVWGKSLTLGLGVYAPPTVGRYNFNEPRYDKHDETTGGRPGTYIESPRKFAPQRYSLIATDNIILFPGVSVAFQPHKRVSVGASFQYVFSTLHFAQTITTSDATGRVNEEPIYDAQVTVDMHGKGGFTGVLGVLVAPLDNLRFGLSLRPPTKILASGTMAITLGEAANPPGAEPLARVIGDQADLELTLPLELRVGAHYRPIPAVGVNVDVVYERWEVLREIILTPTNIQQQIGEQEPRDLAQIRLSKNWRNTLSVRAGGSYRFGFGLELRGGVMAEQQASPDEYFNLDFPHPARVFVTGGASYVVGPVELVLGGAFTPTQTVVVTTSEVRQITSDHAVPGNVVGNGTYTSGGWIATLGIRGRFGVPKIE